MTSVAKVPLSEISEFVTDGTHASPERTENGIPVLSAQHVLDGRLSYTTDRFTSQEEYESFAKRVSVRQDDILLTIVGTIGRAAVVDEVRPLVFQRSVAIIRPEAERILPRFLFHALASHDVRSQLIRASNQSSQAGVYLGKLKKIHVPCMPILEQRRIANILDHTDALRARRRAAIEELDQLARSIFLEMFGCLLSDSSHWKTLKLGEIPDLFMTSGPRGWGKYYSEEGAVFLRIQNVRHNELALDDVAFVNPPDTAEARRTRVQPGDVLMSITADLGRTAVIPRNLGTAFINQHLILLRTGEFNPEFLAAFLTSTAGQQQIRQRNRHGVKAGLNFDDIRSLEILCPPRELQEIYASRIAALDRLKATHRAHLAELDALFASLQHRAFRGEL